MSFPARYPGICTECDDEIQPDEQIQHDGASGYRHAECRALVRPTPPTCPICWLVQPCEHTEDS